MKTKMRFGASVVATLVAATFVGIVAPAAYADDTAPDSNATSVATESIVADDAPNDSSTPAVQDSTDTTPAPDSSADTTPSTDSNANTSDAPVADEVADPEPSASAPVSEPEQAVAPAIAPAVEPAAEPSVPTVSSSVTVDDIDLLPYCFKGQPGFAGTILLQNSGAEVTGPLTIGPSDNPGQFAYGDITVGSGADIGSLFNLAPGTYSMAVAFDGTVIGGPYALTIPVDVCGPVVQPASAQVSSFVASATTQGNDRLVRGTGSVSLTNVSDLSTVAVTVSVMGGTSVTVPIDANHDFVATLAGNYPDGVYEAVAQAMIGGRPTGTPVSMTVEFKGAPPATEFTPPPPVVKWGQCTADGIRQAVVTFADVTGKGYYYVNGETQIPLSGTMVLTGQLRFGFQFAEGYQPPKNWPGLPTYTPEKCEVVTPTDPEQPQEPSQPATPVVLPEAPKPAEPAVDEASDEDIASETLAQTGQDGKATGALALAGLFALGGGLMLVLRRRRATQ